MHLVAESTTPTKAIRDYLAAKRLDAEKLRLGICAGDQMYAHSLAECGGNAERALVEYYRTGLNIYDTVIQILEWHFGSVREIKSLLDFACGYGRFTRFLLQALSPDRIWGSDIYGRAVEFQRGYLGVNGILSVTNPDEFCDEHRFDCVLASSFFTHAPESTFASWLKRLYSILRPGGLLVFSVHDIALLAPELRPDDSTLFFRPGSYDSQLPAAEFGGTYVEESRLREILNSVGAPNSCIQRIKAGLDFFQDVYLVTNRPSGWTTPLKFDYLPFANLYTCTPMENGDIHLAGCATDHFNENGSISTVELSVDGKVIQRCVPDRDWPEIAEYFHNPAALHSGWDMKVKRTDVKHDDIAVLCARNSRNREYVFHCGAIPP